MPLHNFKKGELAHWLQVVSDNARTPAAPVPVPPQFVEALITLRCVERDASGVLVVTQKGRLALHMEGGGEAEGW